jgi:hypothetical protein
MAVSTRNNIVTNGLVLYLDAANSKSYVSGSTTWSDMSGNGNTGTVTGGPAYSTLNGGSIVFDNDAATIPYSSTFDFSNQQTVVIWMKPTTGAPLSRRNPYNQAYGGPGTITHELAGNFNYYFGTNGGNTTPYTGITSNFTVIENELACIAVTRNQTTNAVRWYKNGTFTNEGNAGGYAATNNGSSPIYIGTGYAGNFLGNIYQVAVYNRALTQAEITQNYNATKTRFNLT